MKKIILAAIILITLSCSTEQDLINNCGCLETQQRKSEVRFWTGGAWMYEMRWNETGLVNSIEGCFTEQEAKYMTVQSSDTERWFVTCNEYE